MRDEARQGVQGKLGVAGAWLVPNSCLMSHVLDSCVKQSRRPGTYVIMLPCKKFQIQCEGQVNL